MEVSYNRSPYIDKWNKRVGAPLGSPYCASFVSYILTETGATYPKVRSAWSRAFITSESIKATEVFYGADIPHSCVAVFVRRGGGHIGFVVGADGRNAVHRRRMQLFEANTSPQGVSGSQHNGTWTGYRTRSVKAACSPYAAFRITHFTPVRYTTRAEQR